MREFLRPLLLVSLALAIPVVPFLFFGETLERRVRELFDPPPGDATIAALVVGVLATDILLPIPSSAVSTLAGATLGIVVGSLASLLGMTLGSVLGYWLAQTWGPPLVQRFAKAEDLAKIEALSDRFGPGLLLLMRPLPVLAEASVLIFGTARLGWRRFLSPVLVGNLVISASYAALGAFSAGSSYLPAIVLATMALPILLTEAVRRRLKA